MTEDVKDESGIVEGPMKLTYLRWNDRLAEVGGVSFHTMGTKN